MWTICEDNRIIKALWFPDESCFDTGEHTHIDKIVPYRENGGMACVIWFAVCSKGEIVNRVNAAHVQTIQYKGE